MRLTRGSDGITLLSWSARLPTTDSFACGADVRPRQIASSIKGQRRQLLFVDCGLVAV